MADQRDVYEDCLECEGSGLENEFGDYCPECLGVGRVLIATTPLPGIVGPILA